MSAQPSIETLLPHRAPALLIVACTESGEGLRCTGRIASASPFAANDAAPAFLGLELGAQAAAVLEGRARAGAGEPPVGMGFLVGVRSVRFHRARLPVETDLAVEVEPVEAAPPLRTYRITVAHRGVPCVEGLVSTWSEG